MERGTAITGEVYCETFNKIRRAIQNRQHGKLLSGIILFRNNAHPHTAVKIQEKIQDFRRELFNHSLYTVLTLHLENTSFSYISKNGSVDNTLKTRNLRTPLKTGSACRRSSFYAGGLRKLVKQYKKCLKVNSDYVEK
jgi:hypothetical protein